MNSIYSFWHFDPIIMAFLAMLSAVYLFITDFHPGKQSYYFFGGILLIIFCVASPFHYLAENYLFSAHMLLHVILVLIVAPLMVLGIPAENKLKKDLLFLSEKLSRMPFLGWFTGVGIMWFWHIPYIFNQMFSMQNRSDIGAHLMSGLMYVHLLSLVLAGVFFCWPVINPYKNTRMYTPVSVLYLSTACMFCTILGLMITFGPVGLYTHYSNIMDGNGFLPLIRNEWKISPQSDQQIAGLIMWVPCCILYLSASMILLLKWFWSDEKEMVQGGYDVVSGS